MVFLNDGSKKVVLDTTLELWSSVRSYSNNLLRFVNSTTKTSRISSTTIYQKIKSVLSAHTGEPIPRVYVGDKEQVPIFSGKYDFNRLM